jgi:hypothetical protein
MVLINAARRPKIVMAWRVRIRANIVTTGGTAFIFRSWRPITTIAGIGSRGFVSISIVNFAPNRHLAGLYQWVSPSSTQTVDNPVDKVFDNRVNVADSLRFLRIAENLGDIQLIDIIEFNPVSSNRSLPGYASRYGGAQCLGGCDQFS